jgi:NDP-sugar pyrophosphorylase family protein
VGSHGEAILDYSLYDAHEAGFETAVIIIKEAIRADFMDTVGKRLEKSPMEIRYAYQEIDKIPEGVAVPECRKKPWGTGHAVLCAAEVIGDAPFAVINSDDYYGKSAFKSIYEALCNAQDTDKYEYCMVGYELGKTVTDNGSVARGVCSTDANGYLTDIHERTRIEVQGDAIRFTEDGENWTELAPDTVVSMNTWGFTPGFLKELKTKFATFIAEEMPKNPEKAEFFLPFAVADLLAEGKARAKVLHSADKWYGITYAADKPQIVAALRRMAEEGKYPDSLWG